MYQNSHRFTKMCLGVANAHSLGETTGESEWRREASPDYVILGP